MSVLTYFWGFAPPPTTFLIHLVEADRLSKKSEYLQMWNVIFILLLLFNIINLFTIGKKDKQIQILIPNTLGIS